MKWSRIKMRTAMAFVAVVALALGCFMQQCRVAEDQRRTVAAIRLGRGKVWYDYEWPSGKRNVRGGPNWAPWLVRWLGRDFFSHVVRVDFEFDEKNTDSDLVHVASLSQLEELNLARSSITNQGLIHLAKLSGLRLVDLENTSVDDHGLVFLRRLTGLQSLNLNNTGVSDGGLASLAGLSRLEELHLAETDVGDDGLAHLENLVRLRILDLRDARVTDRGMVHLMRMKNLELLDVDSTMVTDFGAHDLRQTLPTVKVLFRHLRL
jgi:Leucine Rich repeat